MKMSKTMKIFRIGPAVLRALDVLELEPIGTLDLLITRIKDYSLRNEEVE